MGTLQLECPLCCSETFPSHSSLKYHLLSIIDNLNCPACGSKFNNIHDLAEHLENDCQTEEHHNTEPTSHNYSTKFKSPSAGSLVKKNVKQNSISGGSSVNSTSAAVTILVKEECGDSDPAEIDIDESQLESFLDSSTLAKTLINSEGDSTGKDQEEYTTTEVTAEDETSDEDLYHCSSCDINFTSVEEHLRQYHEGHQVFLENVDSCDVDKAEFVKVDMDYHMDENEEVPTIELDDDDIEDKLDSSIIPTKQKNPQVLNTVTQQECFDKDGRLYTRKVVKIEKFWDEQPTREDPITQKYILIGKGKAEIATEEKLAKLKDKKKLLEVHQCSKCLVQFAKLEHYHRHDCEGNRDFKCAQCESSFYSSKSLCAHMKVHKETHKLVNSDNNDLLGPFICEICNTEFPVFKSLRLHRRMHDPIKVKEIEAPVTYGMLGEITSNEAPTEMFICEVCNKTYNKQYEEAHKRFHSNEANYDCEICNRKFYTSENLEMHMRVHSNGKKFTCSYCKKGFLTYESLQTHITSQCQQRRYECQYCGRRFARPHEKVKHERIHTGEKPHKCEICGKAFRVSYCLTLHMRTHSGTRPYQCQHCGKRFKAHSVYNHHLLTHSDVRAYKCPYCPKAFKTGVQLAGHKNSHIKPFTCTECNRPFASLYAVRAHMETHQRQNNLKYSCWLCGASYARAFALRDHVKEQHADEEPKDDNVLEPDDGKAQDELSSHDMLPVEEDTEVLMELDDCETETVEDASVIEISENVE